MVANMFQAVGIAQVVTVVRGHGVPRYERWKERDDV